MDNRTTRVEVNKKKHDHKLSVGFVPLVDCAPLVMAHELGLFYHQGLRVELKRELGWATVRDKVIFGELEASHALAPTPLVAALGLGSASSKCITALVMSLDGNGITVSKELADILGQGPHSFKEHALKSQGEDTLTFGVVSAFSSHRHMMRLWLTRLGIDPERDVRVVVVPPPQMVANLKAGNLDGFCSGEPWNSMAEISRSGVCVATSRDLDPGHPEKILMVRQEFAETRREEHLALVAALIEACEWCSKPQNHEKILTTLARPEYVGVPASALSRGIRDLCYFTDRQTSEPALAHAAWAHDLVRKSGLCGTETLSRLNLNLARSVFRMDLHEAALNRLNTNTEPNEHEIEKVVH